MYNHIIYHITNICYGANQPELISASHNKYNSSLVDNTVRKL